MTRRPAVSAALMVGAILTLAVGGCGPVKARTLDVDGVELQQVISKSDRPALVDFIKEGCATCVMLDSTIDQLAEEYDGRVTVVKFPLMRLWMQVTNADVMKQNHVGIYPTVVLFVNGEEKKRWAADYSIDHYRKALNEVVVAPPSKESKTADPPDK